MVGPELNFAGLREFAHLLNHTDKVDQAKICRYPFHSHPRAAPVRSFKHKMMAAATLSLPSTAASGSSLLRFFPLSTKLCPTLALPTPKRFGSATKNSTVCMIAKFGNGRYIREDYLVKKVSAKEVEELVKGERTVPIVLDFYATWCGPCILMAQELETVMAACSSCSRPLLFVHLFIFTLLGCNDGLA